MKLLKFICIAAATISMSSAATISVSGGFGVGVLVATNAVNVTSTLEVGGFEGGIFTAFAAPAVNLAAGAKIAGSFPATTPASLNSDPIFLRVSTSDGFAILSTASLFPSDVGSALASTTVTFSSSASGSVVSFGGANVQSVSFSTPNRLNFVTIPEPSAALLGAIGALGLLRRRRI